jgi:hypothetical protein
VDVSIPDSTVASILKEHRIEPTPHRQRQTTWKTFLGAHREVLAAVDFTTIEVWTRGGLVTFYILVVMRLFTRRVETAGVTPHPDGTWVQQAGRNPTDCYDGFLRDTRYLLLDRDKKLLPLRHGIESMGTKLVLLRARRYGHQFGALGKFQVTRVSRHRVG